MSDEGRIGTTGMILTNQLLILGCVTFLLLTSPHVGVEPKPAANVMLLIWTGAFGMFFSKPLGKALEIVVEWYTDSGGDAAE